MLVKKYRYALFQAYQRVFSGAVQDAGPRAGWGVFVELMRGHSDVVTSFKRRLPRHMYSDTARIPRVRGLEICTHSTSEPSRAGAHALHGKHQYLEMEVVTARRRALQQTPMGHKYFFSGATRNSHAKCCASQEIQGLYIKVKADRCRHRIRSTTSTTLSNVLNMFAHAAGSLPTSIQSLPPTKQSYLTSAHDASCKYTYLNSSRQLGKNSALISRCVCGRGFEEQKQITSSKPRISRSRSR